MYLKTLTLIHAALVFGLVIFGAISYFSGVGFVGQFEVTNDVFIYLIPIAAMLGYFGSKIYFKKQLETIRKSDPLPSKLAKYKVASIVKYAFIEGPAVLALFIFMGNGYSLYFSIAFCLVLYLLVQRPTKDKLVQDLDLSPTEQQEMEKK
jgi:hypothetical protein